MENQPNSPLGTETGVSGRAFCLRECLRKRAPVPFDMYIGIATLKFLAGIAVGLMVAGKMKDESRTRLGALLFLGTCVLGIPLAKRYCRYVGQAEE
jgi:hypothetical protein